MSADPPHTGPVTVHDLRRVEWRGAAAKHQLASYGQAAARAKGGCRNLGHWPATSAPHASMSRRIVASWSHACAIYAPHRCAYTDARAPVAPTAAREPSRLRGVPARALAVHALVRILG